MRVAYFDPFSGVSGDMVLGALIDAGVDVDALRSGLRGLDLDGYELRAEPARQHGVSGTRVTVAIDRAAGQPPRDWRTIRGLIAAARLSEATRRQALDVFAALAEAEAGVHGTPVEDVHFHEIGAVDAVIDIVGAVLGLELLGINAAYAGPLPLGSGFVETAHGRLPLPAPATAALIARAGAPTRGIESDAELVTPTGAAIVTRLARFERPPMRVDAVGYGFGTRELPWPNALRLWLGDLDEAALPPGDEDGPEELLLETNIDDMNPEFFELLVERLFEAGAFDVYLAPITMKRGRPATKVSVIAASRLRPAIEDVLMANSTTLGVRALPLDRTKAGRRVEAVTTRWGDVRIKLKIWRGRVTDVAPEYADCLQVARAAEVPIKLVYGEAVRIAEAYVGRRLEPEDDTIADGTR